MASKRISKDARVKYVRDLRKLGEAGLYRKIIGRGMRESADIIHPEDKYLNYSEAFAALYRSSGNEDYATLSRILRRAAHCIYRELIRQDGSRPVKQHRFLTLCS